MAERATVTTCPDALGRTVVVGGTIAVPVVYAGSITMRYAVVEEIFLKNTRGQHHLFYERTSLDINGEKRYMCWNEAGDASEIGVTHSTNRWGGQEITRITQSYALRVRQIGPETMWGLAEKPVIYSMSQNILRMNPAEVQTYLQQKDLLNQTPEKD